MTVKPGLHDAAFKRALILSGAFHTLLLLVIVLNPSLPQPQRKGIMVFLPTNMIGSRGGGGRGGAAGPVKVEEKLAPTEVKRETLRDLAPLANAKVEPKSQLRSPTDKPKRETAKKAPDKKASIGKPDPSLKTTDNPDAPAGGSGARGAGLTIGAGGPGFGEGIGGDLAGQIGMSDFAYSYYLTWVCDKISSNWFTSLVDPGITGTYRAAVYFRIQRNGAVTNLAVRQSSGIPSLDRSAERAILSSAPFAPLPADYRENYLSIILIFEHSK